MKKVQRIEIVIDAGSAPRVIELLRKSGVDGHSLIRGVSGSGERGLRQGDDISGALNNNYILTTCAPEKLDEVIETLTPVLSRVGGVCLVSEATWVVH